jgi:hypothetical protein
VVIPPRKTVLIRALHGRRPWGLTEEEGGGEGWGGCWGSRGPWGGVAPGGGLGPALLLRVFVHVRTVQHEEEEMKREKRKEEREGKKGKIFQTWKFPERKIKDNLLSWFINYFWKRKKYA